MSAIEKADPENGVFLAWWIDFIEKMTAIGIEVGTSPTAAREQAWASSFRMWERGVCVSGRRRASHDQ
jgi:hypothetical protein